MSKEEMKTFLGELQEDKKDEEDVEDEKMVSDADVVEQGAIK